MQQTESDFVSLLFKKLEERDNRESGPYAEIVKEYENVVEKLLFYRTKALDCQKKIEDLKQENIELHLFTLKTGSGSNLAKDENFVKLFEDKIQSLKKEAEDAKALFDKATNEIHDLTVQIKENDTKITVLEADLKLKEGAIKNLEKTVKKSQRKMSELESTNQLLIDEQQALQLAFEALEEKYVRCKDENNELVERWLKQKSQDIDRINLENDRQQKKTNKKMSKDLAQAVNETYIDIDGENLKGVGSFSSTFSPSWATYADFNVKAVSPSRMLYEIISHDSEVTAIAPNVTSDRSFVTGGADRKIKLWEIDKNCCECKAEFSGSSGGITCLQFDPNGTLLLASSNDFATRLWTISDHRLRHTLTGHSGKVLAARFIDSGTKVITGSYDRTLKIWDITNKTCIETLFAGSSCNDLVTLDKGGNCIISGHIDKKLRVWDVRIASSSHTNPAGNRALFSNFNSSAKIPNSTAMEIDLPAKITSLDASLDQTLILCSTRDDVLRTIDMRFSNLTKFASDFTMASDDMFHSCLKGIGFHIAYDWSRACLSPDKSMASCGSSNGYLYIWDLNDQSFQKLCPNINSSNPVICCKWSTYGNYFISCDSKKKTYVWS